MTSPFLLDRSLLWPDSSYWESATRVNSLFFAAGVSLSRMLLPVLAGRHAFQLLEHPVEV